MQRGGTLPSDPPPCRTHRVRRGRHAGRGDRFRVRLPSRRPPARRRRLLRAGAGAGGPTIQTSTSPSAMSLS